MEMDEIISQIQQWRRSGVAHRDELDDADETTKLTGSTYHSEAYDRLFKPYDGPESDAPTVLLVEKKYTADDEMIAKVAV